MKGMSDLNEYMRQKVELAEKLSQEVAKGVNQYIKHLQKLQNANQQKS